MRIAVTGGAGFLGRHVVEELVAGDHEVTIIDLVAPDWLRTDDVKYVKNDLSDWMSLYEVFNRHQIQVVMHLAAISNTNQAFREPVTTMQVNSVGTQNVYEAARHAHVDRVVLAGSTLVSGAYADLGIPEGDPEYGHDEDSLFDLSQVVHPYVMSKIHIEMVASTYAALYDVQSTVFRYGIQYGRSMAPGVVAHAFITNAIAGKPLTVHGDGSQWRQYTHVTDIARAHALLVSEDQLETEHIGTFHICGREKVSIASMAELVAELTKAEIEYGPPRGDDIDVKYCLTDKAQDFLGWTPQVSLEGGFRGAIDHYRSELVLDG